MANRYDFTVILKGSPELTEDVADGLFAAGCDDGSPGVCEGVFSIDFHREAESLESAISSAVQDIRRAGHEVDRVEIEAADLAQVS